MPASLLTQRAAFLSSIASKQFAHRKSNVVVNFSGAFVLWGAHAPRVLAIAPSRSRTSCPLSVSGSRTGWRFGEGAETSTRAAPKPRTGITDSGYNGPWSSAKIFADGAYTPAGNHRHGYPPPRMSHWLDWNRSGFRLCILYRCRHDGRGHRWDRCRDRHSGWWRYARCCGKYRPCSKSRRFR